MMLLASAGPIALYLGLELMSLSCTCLPRSTGSVRASEAGLEIFRPRGALLRNVLYEASLIYGLTGTVTITACGGCRRSRLSVTVR